MRTLLPLTCLTLLAIPAAAQSPLTGFAPASAAREQRTEAALQTGVDTASARLYARTLAGKPHVAGTPAQQETADFVLRTMAGYGLDTSRVNFKVWIPFPDSTIVEIERPERRRLDLTEPPVPGDPTTQLPAWPAMNGTAGSGDVTAPVVYANYGLPDDYAVLDSLGVDVRGKVVIARYGRSFRGIKEREAADRGAAALLLYSDPQDDGYVRGDVYPQGPMRPPAGVQRGSVLNLEGDPTTPGYPSVAGAHRVPLDSLALPRIPVVPMGYGNAQLILQPLAGAPVPQSFQGGLPFHYHVGGTPDVTVRVGLWHQQGEKGYKTITNTFGVLRGSQWPADMVIIGGHRDAWGPGAGDNVSGTVTVMEAAKAWAAVAKSGLRPRRTLVFATWDAEEWGLVGSTEWVELMRDSLSRHAVAYINQDDAAEGRSFGAAATASLAQLVRDVTKTVSQPGDSGSVYASWRARGGRRGGAGRSSPDTADVPLGDLGGGSDFAGFYNTLGIPAMGMGFGGPAGVYHSAYDTYTFRERFSDPGYLAHAAEGRIAAVTMGRLANADLLPLDYADFGHYLEQLVGRTRKAAQEAGIDAPFDSLAAAAARLTQAGEDFNAARAQALNSGAPAAAVLARTNDLLRGVEAQITRPAGLKGRPDYRNLMFAADRDNGYADMPLPGIGEALRDRDVARARFEVLDLAQRVGAAAARVEAARAALSTGGRAVGR